MERKRPHISSHLWRMRMRGLEPPRTCIHTDLNRAQRKWLCTGATDVSILHGLRHGLDASDDVTVAKLLPRSAPSPQGLSLHTTPRAERIRSFIELGAISPWLYFPQAQT